MAPIKGIGKVIYNKTIGRDCFRMGLEIKPRLGKILPGQFIHLRLSSGFNPLLRRPFSIYRVLNTRSRRFSKVEILYQVVGKGTRLMARMKPGTEIDVICPLGNGFWINQKAKVSLLVAGGIGTAGLHLLLQDLIKAGLDKKGRQIYSLVGARTKKELYLLDSFRSPEANPKIATEDGSAGQKGLVTDLLTTLIQNLKSAIRNPQSTIQIYACGPDGMNQTVSRLALEYQIPCQVSMERQMGCGVGICRACVCKVKNDKSFRYATVCSEGPIFEANQLVL